MRNHILTAVAVLLGCTAPSAALADHHEEAPRAAVESATSDIVTTAVRAGSFETLAAAFEAADLVDALRGEGPFTVFAPTDAAFAALPEGTVAALLRPENKATLQRILAFHVVPGRVAASDLLPATSARSLAGDAIPIGLRVGNANVVKTDIACSNGVIHVIDAVLLPSAKKDPASMNLEETLTDAIDRGVPAFNGGDPAECARIYREAAKRALTARGIGQLHALRLEEALRTPTADDAAEAWLLREAFDVILTDTAFEPRIEAPLPEGFPGPGPVGSVVRKKYPQYRAARADGGQAFWTLFNHIKENEVAMTAPVEMTMDDDMRMKDMAFLYEKTSQGKAGEQGPVAVLDLEPREVLSIGIRGRRSSAGVARARRALQSALDEAGLEADGPWRVIGYNSPMVPQDEQFWELQVPITR